MNKTAHIVPKQVTGSRSGASSRKKNRSAKDARKLYDEACSRLLNVNNWYELCGRKGAEFFLTDKTGRPLPGVEPEVGDLIRIKLPAPPNEKGDGFDWVRVEQFESSRADDEEQFGFRVRPVSNPRDRSAESAHFYTSEATSTFLVRRKGRIVYAIEYGRNEKPNPTGRWLNKLRNILIAVPAMLGLSKPQWKLLTKGLLQPASEK